MRALRCSVFAGLLFATLSVQPARAEINAVDVAFQAIVIAGNVAGIPISPEEAAFIKGLVQCTAGGKSLEQCVGQAVIKAALANTPEEAQKFATCLVSSGDPLGCAKEAVIDAVLAKLPGSVAKDFAKCVADGGDPVACVNKVVLSQVPEQARPLVKCIADGGDAADCVAKFAAGALDEATQNAIKNAVATVEKAKANGNHLINNITELIQGIQESDYEKILHGGGAEVVKAVSNIILAIFLTPAAASALAPVVDDFVQNRADFVQNLLKAAHKGDVVKIAQLVLEFWLTIHIEQPCALLPNGDFQDATCGNLAKLIVAVGNAGADLAKDILSLGEDFLKTIGLYQIGDKVVTWAVDAGCDVPLVRDVLGWFGTCPADKPPPPPQDCGTAEDYFANNYLACLTTGTDAKAIHVGLTNACTAKLSRCYSNAAQSCQAMDSKFNSLVNRLSAALTQGAGGYASTASATAFALSKGDAACSADFWEDYRYEFIESCVNALNKNIPWSNNHCPVRSGMPPELRAPWKACEAALNKVDLNAIAAAMKDKYPNCGAQMACTYKTRTDPDGKVYSPTGLALLPVCEPLLVGKPGYLFDVRQDNIASRISNVRDTDDLFKKLNPVDDKQPALEKAPAAVKVPAKKPSATSRVSKTNPTVPRIDIKPRSGGGFNTSRSPDGSGADRIRGKVDRVDRSSSGFNTSRSPGSVASPGGVSAMDRLGGGAIDKNVPSSTFREIKKGTSSAPATSEPGSVDYGGCARCGQDKFRAPK